MKTTIWVIFTNFRKNGIPYFLNTSDFGISEEEINLNIMEQVYGKILNLNKRKFSFNNSRRKKDVILLNEEHLETRK